MPRKKHTPEQIHQNRGETGLSDENETPPQSGYGSAWQDRTGLGERRGFAAAEPSMWSFSKEAGGGGL